MLAANLKELSSSTARSLTRDMLLLKEYHLAGDHATVQRISISLQLFEHKLMELGALNAIQQFHQLLLLTGVEELPNGFGA
jgi:hypothetical protein